MNFENYEIEHLAIAGLDLTAAIFDASNPDSEIELISINKMDFEAWLISECIVQKYLNNEDSQRAAFDEFYSNEIPKYANVKAYLLSDEFKISNMVDAIFELNNKCKSVGVPALDITEIFYHENKVA